MFRHVDLGSKSGVSLSKIRGCDRGRIVLMLNLHILVGAFDTDMLVGSHKIRITGTESHDGIKTMREGNF